MIGNNATVKIWRKGSYDPATKQTPAYALLLSDVSVYIYDKSQKLLAAGVTVEWSLEMTADIKVDVRDGDLVTDYNPLGLSPEPKYMVHHVIVAPDALGAHRAAYLQAYRG